MSQEKSTASLDHLNLTVRNFAESAAWYKEIFNFSIEEQGETPDGQPWGILRNGDSMLCVFEEKGRAPAAESSTDSKKFHRIEHFALRIKNQTAWEKTLKGKQLRTYYGGEIKYPFSTSWYIKDPSGYTIEVVSWRDDRVRFC